MQSALDKVAPICGKRIKTQTPRPWVDEEVISERKLRRKLERKMLKDRDPVSKNNYRIQRKRVNEIIEQKKIAFFHSSIKDCAGDQKALYQLMKKLANKPIAPVFPESPSDDVLANQFSDFFKSKIEKINAQFTDHDGNEHSQIPTRLDGSEFTAFPPITQEEFQKFILQSPTKSCALDPIPCFLLKKVWILLFPY